MLKPGDPAPPFRQQPVFGLPVDLEQATRRYPVLLYFGRYLGCVHFRDNLARLQQAWPRFDVLGATVVAITRSDLDTARDFVPRYHLLYPMVCDPEGALYAQWQVPVGSRLDAIRALTPGAVKVAAAAVRHGIDPREALRPQLPAAFVVAPGGRIAWVRQGEHIDDELDIEAALEEVQRCLA